MHVITGATGNIGSKLSDILLTKGEKIRVVGRSAERLQPLVSRGSEAATGDLGNTAFLQEAFAGAKTIFSMIPPKYDAEDFRKYQNQIGESLASAIRESGVGHVVSLSSQGADLPEKTGPIKGLYDQEQRLNRVEGVNVLHLRPAYFMENLLMYVPMIRTMHLAGSAIRGDLKFPMIATKDIAEAVADHLVKKDFSGKTVGDLLGQRDVSLEEAFRIIGAKIGKPDLKYAQFSYEDAEKGLVAAGLSRDVSRLFIEMGKAFNEGLIGKTKRTRDNTTETPIEAFAEVFARAYGG